MEQHTIRMNRNQNRSYQRNEDVEYEKNRSYIKREEDLQDSYDNSDKRYDDPHSNQRDNRISKANDSRSPINFHDDDDDDYNNNHYDFEVQKYFQGTYVNKVKVCYVFHELTS